MVFSSQPDIAFEVVLVPRSIAPFVPVNQTNPTHRLSFRVVEIGFGEVIAGYSLRPGEEQPS
jgi:hypothetical protein